MEPDDIRTEKGQRAYPYRQVDTLVFEELSDEAALVAAMGHADDYADQLLEDAENEEPDSDDLSTVTYGYVWTVAAVNAGGPPFTSGPTISGYERFKGLNESGPFYLEVEVRLYEPE